MGTSRPHTFHGALGQESGNGAEAFDIIPAFSGVSQDLPTLEGAQAQEELDIPPV